MTVLKHFEQMHKSFDIEKGTEPKAGCDPAEALAGLCKTLESEDGFALLTGPAGAGKSMLVQELLPHLTSIVCRVTIPDKEMTNRDFRRFLAEALGLETKVQSRGAFLLKIRDFLMTEAVKDHRIILVLESIQCLDKKLFKEFELLSDIRIRDRNPLTFLFVGLTEAESIFSDPHLAKINNRICAKIRLKDANSDDVGNAPPEPGVRAEPEGKLPLGSGLEPDASPVEMNQFQECDWEDRVLMHYIDQTPLNSNPVRQRSEQQWYNSSTVHGRSIDDGWEEDPVANGPVLKRSSLMWGALSAISVLLVFFAVWIQFFDKSGALSRFFTDTAAKIESALLAVWQSDTGDVSPEADAKPSLTSSETNASEPANPASPGRDRAADAWPLQTGAMVLFDSNSYVIGPEYAKLLDRVAAYLERHQEQHVSLRGYSDNIGNRDYNLFISKYRALVVKYYLINKGVPADRMQILGMGDGYPVGSNDTPEGRRHNRRVEIKLIPGSSADPGRVRR